MDCFLESKTGKVFLSCFLFITVFIVSFVVTYVCMPIICDDIWLFGFSYNINKGLVIYRDFNVVTTPLYYFVGSLFLKIFGNYIIVMGIFNSILVGLIFLMMFRIIKLKAFTVLPLILIFYPNGYNLFCLFWLMLILFLITRNKNNDILLGFVLGLLFITKQNIGVALLIPYIYYSKKKIRSLVCFFIPFLVISLYLMINNAFCEFIDYCFLGLFDFGTGNHYFDIFSIMEIFVLLYLIVVLLKSKFRNKEVFYILMFQIMMYPLSDAYHFFVSFFPVMYYVVKNLKSIYILIIIFFCVWLFNIVLFFSVEHKFYLKNDILFLKNCGDLPLLMNDFNNYLDEIEYYYFADYYGYLYKLYYGIPISQYDLWNEGNMGYKGLEKRMKEVDNICKYNECLFIVNADFRNNRKSQVSRFCDYIVDNYEVVEEFNTFFIYSNSEKKYIK